MTCPNCAELRELVELLLLGPDTVAGRREDGSLVFAREKALQILGRLSEQ